MAFRRRRSYGRKRRGKRARPVYVKVSRGGIRM